MLDDAGDLLHIARDLAGHHGLLLYSSGDLAHLSGYIVDQRQNSVQRLTRAGGLITAMLHLAHPLLHQCHRLANLALDGANHGAYLAGSRSRATGQRPHLIGHHRKTPPLLARSGRLDGRIERQQIGLGGDLPYGADNVANLVGAHTQSGHRSG